MRQRLIILSLLIVTLIVASLYWSFFIVSRATPNPSPSLSPYAFEVEGETACLPHRDTRGPVTLECAIGLRTNDGVYYGLTNMTPPLYIMQTQIKVKGTLKPDGQGKYDTQGDIAVTTWEPLE